MASMQGRAETTTWRIDLANQLHTYYTHVVIWMHISVHICTHLWEIYIKCSYAHYPNYSKLHYALVMWICIQPHHASFLCCCASIRIHAPFMGSSRSMHADSWKSVNSRYAGVIKSFYFFHRWVLFINYYSRNVCYVTSSCLISVSILASWSILATYQFTTLSLLLFLRIYITYLPSCLCDSLHGVSYISRPASNLPAS